MLKHEACLFHSNMIAFHQFSIFVLLPLVNLQASVQVQRRASSIQPVFAPSSNQVSIHVLKITVDRLSHLSKSYLSCNGSPSLQLQPSCQGCSHNSQVSHLGLYKGKTIGILVQCLSHQLSSWADALSSCHWWSFLYFAVEEIPVRKNDRHLYKEF